MSGSVAEALLASGSKKLPLLLPPPPKLKKDPQTFAFDLELPESNEQTYPEYSWTELVKNAKQKELSKKAASGNLTLNPYASDDEEDLKAMAAKFEAKYSNPGTTKKKKRRVEDYIDKGAGYDESDPFIDNSDVYDEVVPADLQTVHGGFYINSGSLDFKEVELSEDEEDSLSQQPKVPKIKKAKTKITHPVPGGVLPKPKNPVGRPPGGGNKRPVSVGKMVLPKKRKIIYTPVGTDGKSMPKMKKMSAPAKPDNSKPKVVNVSSSSGSSSSSSSDDSSSSSDSDSSSEEETEEKKDTPKFKNAPPAPVKVKASIVKSVLPKQMNVPRQTDTVTVVVPGSMQTQPKRLKTKNVPLNPKLHPNLSVATSMSSLSSNTSINITSTPQVQPKVLSKDLIKTNGGSSMNISPRNQSPSSIMPVPTSSPSLKIPPPKPVSTPMVSPGITISTVTPQSTKSSSNVPGKQKIKNKSTVNSINVSPSQLDIFNTLSSYTLPNLSNFAPNLAPSASILKGGINMIGAPKAMPNLKKMTQAASSTEKLVQKQPKTATPKPVKSKQKQTNITSVTPPTSHSNAFNTSGGSATNYLTMTSYKTPPPPLAGPGVEISKVRSSTVMNSNTTPKGSANATPFSSSALGLATVSLAHTTSNNSLTSSILNAGISSYISSTANTLSSMSSSLMVQKLPQSITITPTSQQNLYPIPGMTSSSNKNVNIETKVTKHNSAFDMSSLLQNPVVNYPSTLLGIGNSKSGAGKSTNSLSNNRDIQRK